jgi:integrase/recombinase XerD
MADNKSTTPPPTAQQQQNAELITRFFAYMRAERGCAENTIESYGLDLYRLAKWFNKPVTTIQRQDLSAYAVARLQSGTGPRSVTRSIKAFRSFFRFLIDDEEMAHDPTIGVPLPQYSKPMPHIARQVDVEKMVASLGDSPLEVRDRALLLVLFGSGLRESELANLKLQDIDLQSGVVKIWGGKGGKDAVLPLSDSAIDALKRYLGDVRPKLAEFGVRSRGYVASPYLFLGRRCGDRMTRQNLFYRVRDIAKAALGRSVSPHQLRHGFATVLVENGADIGDVQALMRHARVSTTQIYLHLDLKYLKEKYNASHPRARIANQNPGLFDALPGAQPESTFRKRLPSRPPRLCELYRAGHIADQPKENPQLSADAVRDRLTA